ncbi:transmembrane protein 238-like [Dendropsophus ebraccatus]|uniref:transmembrane protein 238-like n=1 Tax=Dendropsophus ebraccatus TaxID=150705 RepID=UPI003831F672
MSQGAPKRPLGRCSFLFLLAMGFDVLGLVLILTGIFASLELEGRSFGEFFIYSGGILLFFSLLWWLAWYSLNLEVSLEDLMKDPPVSPKKSNLAQLARKFSETFSKRSRRKAESLPKAVPSVPGIPAPLTTSVFINVGFSSHLDTQPPAGGALELNPDSTMNGHGVVDRLV